MNPATRTFLKDDNGDSIFGEGGSCPTFAAKKPACILMASGSGKRFGGNKLLAPLGGVPLIRRILDATDSPLFSRRIVVTRHCEVAGICERLGVLTVLHSLPERRDTIRLGLEAFAGDPPDGCMFCACDQPLLTRETVERMARAFLEQPEYIYRLACGKTAGNPILFPQAYFPALKNLPQGTGGSYISGIHPEKVRFIEADSPWELKDVDTQEDLERMKALLQFSS